MEKPSLGFLAGGPSTEGCWEVAEEAALGLGGGFSEFLMRAYWAFPSLMFSTIYLVPPNIPVAFFLNSTFSSRDIYSLVTCFLREGANMEVSS